MGVTYIEGEVRGPAGKAESVRFLVDSGARYSLLPKAVWQAVGLTPKRRQSFAMADGTMVERSVSEAYFVLPQGESHTPVILGEDGDLIANAGGAAQSLPCLWETRPNRSLAVVWRRSLPELRSFELVELVMDLEE
jgi:predicted aspartyl protease